METIRCLGCRLPFSYLGVLKKEEIWCLSVCDKFWVYIHAGRSWSVTVSLTIMLIWLLHGEVCGGLIPRKNLILDPQNTILNCSLNYCENTGGSAHDRWQHIMECMEHKYFTVNSSVTVIIMMREYSNTLFCM